MAISVAVAVGASADPLVAAIRERAARLHVGPASDDAAEMGPVITGEARDRVRSYVDRGEAAGAKIVADGRQLVVDGHPHGHFIGPTVLDHVTPDMDVYQEEVFGPLLVIVRTDSFDDAVQLIADNAYGNGAAIFTHSGRAARRFAQEVQAGMVGINVPIPVPVGFYSFGGWGDSLFGDSHVYGDESFHFYTRGKVVTARWPEQSSGIDTSFPAS
jgi:malonate-semialdehyde dehydrogenase (acetylating) / methylmalonate-semialdehyde dehydrogenase